MSDEYKDIYNDILTALNAKMWEADLLPDGWTSTFIPELKKELANAHGVIRIYWSWDDRAYNDNEIQDLKELTKEIDSIIAKYAQISEKTCVICGAEATTTTTGWIMPMCTNCFENGV